MQRTDVDILAERLQQMSINQLQAQTEAREASERLLVGLKAMITGTQSSAPSQSNYPPQPPYIPSASVGSAGTGQRLDPALNENSRAGLYPKPPALTLPSGSCWFCAGFDHMRTDIQGNVQCPSLLELIQKGALRVSPKGVPQWPNGSFAPRYDGTNSPYSLVMRVLEARNGQASQAPPSAGVQTIQSTVIYEPYSSSEDESMDEDVDSVEVAINVARAENREGKEVTTRAGRTTKVPRRDIAEPTMNAQRVTKPRRERRAEDIPIMKGRQEGTYEDIEEQTNTQGTLQAEVVEDQDLEMEDLQTAAKPKIPTTTLRKEIKEARKRGDISEDVVMKNVLDATIKLDLQTFLAIAPAIEKRFFGRWQMKDGSSAAPSANLKKMSAGLGRYIESDKDSVRFLTADTPKVNVTVRGASQKGTMQALIDSGAELSVINKKEALELGLPISHDYKLNINGAIGDSAKVWGCCENVVLTIAGKPFVTNIWVMEGLTNPLILGNPFAIDSNLKVSWSSNGSCRVKLIDLRGS